MTSKSSAAAASSTPAAARRDGEAEGTSDMTRRIFNEIYSTYAEDGARIPSLDGVARLEEVASASKLQPPLLHPRKRVSVLIIGNHSAGKSSFINWYAEENVLQASVAVESQGFTVVTFGKDGTPIKGEGTILENRHLRLVADRLGKDRPAFIEYLQTVHVTRAAREMSHLYLIDTPGLVDGEMKYPFDVNNVILELANVCDFILVFMDPIGQALVSRTMNVVRALNERGHASRMRYFLTKADTVPKRDDLNKVIVQVTQNLAGRISLTHGLDIPTIWIPQQPGAGVASAAAASADNSIHKLCDALAAGVRNKVQANMERAREDCGRLLAHLEAEMAASDAAAARRRRWRTYAWLLTPALVALLALAFGDVLLAVEARLPAAVRAAPLTARLLAAARPSVGLAAAGFAVAGYASLGERLAALAAAFLVLSLAVQFFNCRARGLRTASGLPRAALASYRNDVDAIRRHVETLHARYSAAPKVADYDVAN